VRHRVHAGRARTRLRRSLGNRVISDGHTNKSATAVLGVSVNTVGTHLRAVFAKLGVQSRAQLANRFASYASQAVDSMRRPT
jgi:FixJ family two-component response regulator